MTVYRKKALAVRAIQFHQDSAEKIEGVCYGGCSPLFVPHGPHVHTLEGVMTVIDSDWIITGIKGEHYPVKDDIFRASYDEVGE